MSKSAPLSTLEPSASRSRYEEYEDSGIDWLGEIPAHWDVERLQWTVTDCKNGYWGDPPEGEESDINTVRVADFDRFALQVPDQDFTVRSVPPEKRDGRVLEPGDLLLEKSGGGDKQPVGVVMLYDLEKPAVSSNFIARMPVAEGHDPSFLRYLHGALYEAGLNERAIKQSIGIQNLDADQYLNQEVGLPPLDEQHAIAEYLDRETERIDALIEKKEQLIDLLEEKRTALISRVVTKGLGSDVEMQDSGVEWLGEIPAHWQTTKLMHLTPPDRDIMYGIVLPGPHHEGGVPIIKGGNVKPGELRRDNLDCTDPEIDAENPKSRVHGGDIVYAIRGSIGEAEQVPDELDGANLTQDAARISPKEGINGRWLLHVVRSAPFFAQLEAGALGATVKGINIRDLKRGVVPLPPPEEQVKIAEYLDRETKLIAALTDKIEDGIERLEEYRTALISAAVTGKIDVRKDARNQEIKEADTWDRMVLTMELIRRMRAAQHESLGRTLLVKMLYIIQHHVRVTGMGFNYKRKDYGPYASEFRYEVENALQNGDWIQVFEGGKQVQYDLLEKADDDTVQSYFDERWGDVGEQIDEIVSYFHHFDAERAEIVATLYAAWNDLKILGRPHDEDAIIREVRENWHPRKQEIDESRWGKALRWMKEEGLVPTGFGEPTTEATG